MAEGGGNDSVSDCVSYTGDSPGVSAYEYYYKADSGAAGGDGAGDAS